MTIQAQADFTIQVYNQNGQLVNSTMTPEILEANVFNTQGSLVQQNTYSSGTKNVTLNLSGQPAGSYLLKIDDDDTDVEQTIMKN